MSHNRNSTTACFKMTPFRMANNLLCHRCNFYKTTGATSLKGFRVCHDSLRQIGDHCCKPPSNRQGRPEPHLRCYCRRAHATNPAWARSRPEPDAHVCGLHQHPGSRAVTHQHVLTQTKIRAALLSSTSTPRRKLSPHDVYPRTQTFHARRPKALFFFFCFLWPNPWHMEVPGLGVESELHLPAYTTATASRDPQHGRHVCELHSSQQRQILNSLSKARDQTCSLMDTSRVRNPLSHNGSSPKILKMLFQSSAKSVHPHLK